MDYLATGVLKGPHGVHGFIKVHAYSGEYGHLSGIEWVSLRKNGIERQLVVENVRSSGMETLIKFHGIDSPEAARRFGGWELWVPRRSAAKLKEGEYYVADLSSCTLVSHGEQEASVVGVIDGPQSLLLEVESCADGKRYLVPFMSQYIGTVDLDRKEMELVAPWLLA